MDSFDYFIPKWLYPFLKWVALLLLPATATLVVALGGIWGWEDAQSVAATITAVDAFIGAVLGLSEVTKKAN